MAVYKIDLIFKGGSKGWTETYYTQTDNPNLQAIYDYALPMAYLRAELLGAGCAIEAIRCSDTAIENDSFLQYINIEPHTDEPAAPLDVSLNFVCRDLQNKRHRHIFVRGIWHRVVGPLGVFQYDYAPYKTLIDAWRAKLLSDTYGWLGANNATKKKALITGYVRNDSGQVTFTADNNIFAGIPVNTRKKIRVSGLNAKTSNLNRELVVYVLTPNTFQTVLPIAASPFQSQGRVSWYDPEFIRMYTVNSQRIGRRGAGAPLLESVGRSKAQARA